MRIAAVLVISAMIVRVVRVISAPVIAAGIVTRIIAGIGTVITTATITIAIANGDIGGASREKNREGKQK